MAKQLFLNIICSLLVLPAWSQLPGAGSMEDPVSWSHSVEQVSDSTYILHFRADIARDWHLYSQYTAEGSLVKIS